MTQVARGHIPFGHMFDWFPMVNSWHQVGHPFGLRGIWQVPLEVIDSLPCDTPHVCSSVKFGGFKAVEFMHASVPIGMCEGQGM